MSKLLSAETVNLTRIRVFARCRPLGSEEVDDGKDTIEINTEKETVVVKQHLRRDQSFTFDKVFPPQDSQATVFDKAARDCINDVFAGYHGTVFMYGQTGSGKTHTIGCKVKGNEGIIPRAAKYIFEKVAEDKRYDVNITVGYVQIYNEVFGDLLEPDNRNLQIHEDNENGVHLAGSTTHQIHSADELMHYHELGDKNRITALTRLNATSSRSHAILVIRIDRRLKNPNDPNNKEAQLATKANLFLVDLAGSERLKKTKAEGARKTEAAHINKSLSVLGMVVNALSTGGFPPYRDSQLTRLLQGTFTGHGKCYFIICFTTCSDHVGETIGTMQFGQRAMQVKTEAKANQIIDWRLLSEELKQEIENLKVEIADLRVEIDDLNADNASHLEESRNDGAKINKLTDELASLQKRMTAEALAAEKRIQEKQQQMDDAIEKYKQRLAQYEGVEAKKIQKMVTEQQEELALRDREIENLRENLAKLQQSEGMVGDMQQIVLEYVKKEEELTKETRQLRADIKNLNSINETQLEANQALKNLASDTDQARRDAEARVSQLQTVCSDMDMKQREQASQIQTLELKAATLDGQNSTLLKEKWQLEEDLKASVGQVKNYEASTRDLQDEKRRLEFEVQNANGVIQSCRYENERLESYVRESAQNFSALESKLESNRIERAGLERKVTELMDSSRTHLDSCTREITGLKDANSSLQSQLSSCKHECSTLQQEIAQLKDKVVTLENQNKLLDMERHRLEEDRNSLKKYLKQTESDLREQEKTSRMLERSNMKLEQSMNELNLSKRQVEERLAGKEHEHAEALGKIMNLDAQLQQKIRDFDSLSLTNSNLELRIDTMKEEQAKREEENVKRTKELESNALELRGNLLERDNAIRQLEIQKHTLERQQQELDASMKSEHKKYESSLQEQKQIVLGLQEKIRELEAIIFERDQTIIRLQEKNAELEKLKPVVAEKESEIRQLRERLSDVQTSESQVQTANSLYKQNIATLEKRQEVLDTQVRTAIEREQKAEHERKSIENRLENVLASNQDQQQRIEGLLVSLSKHEIDNEHLRSQNARLDKESSETKLALETVRTETQAQLKALEDAQKRDIKELEDRLNKIREESERDILSKHQSSMQAEKQDCSEEKARLREKIDALTIQNESYLKQINELRINTTNLENHISNKGQEIASLKTANKQLDENSRQFKQMYDTTTERLQQVAQERYGFERDAKQAAVDLDEVNKKREQDRKEWQAKIQPLEESLASLRAKLENSTRELNTLKDSNIGLQEQLLTAKHEYSNLSRDVTQLEEKNGALQAQHEVSTKQIHDLRLTVTNLEGQCTNKTQEIITLKSSQHQIEENGKQYKQMYDTTVDRLQQANQERYGFELEAKKNAAQLEEAIKKYEQMRRELQTKIQLLEENVNSLHARLLTSNDEMNKARYDVALKEKDRLASELEIKRLVAQLEQVESAARELPGLKEANTSLQEQTKVAKNDAANAQKDLTQLKDKNALLNAQNDAYLKQISDLRLSVTALEGQCATKTQEIISLRSTYDRLEESTKQLKTKYDKTSEKLQIVTHERHVFEHESKQLAIQLEESSRKRERSRKELLAKIQQLEETINELHAKLLVSNDEVNKAQYEAALKEKDRATLELEMKRLQSQLEDTNKLREQAQQRVNNLEEALMTLQAKWMTCTDEMNTLRQEAIIKDRESITYELEVKRLSAQLETVTKQHDQAQHKAQTLEDRVDLLHTKLLACTEDAHRAQQEAITLKSANSQLEDNSKQYKQLYDSTNEKLQQVSQDKLALELDVKRLTLKLEDAIKQREQVQQEAMQKSLLLEDTINGLHSKLSISNDELIRIQHEVSTLRSVNAQLEENSRQFKQLYDNATERLSQANQERLTHALEAKRLAERVEESYKQNEQLQRDAQARTQMLEEKVNTLHAKLLTASEDANRVQQALVNKEKDIALLLQEQRMKQEKVQDELDRKIVEIVELKRNQEELIKLGEQRAISHERSIHDLEETFAKEREQLRKEREQQIEKISEQSTQREQLAIRALLDKQADEKLQFLEQKKRDETELIERLRTQQRAELDRLAELHNRSQSQLFESNSKSKVQNEKFVNEILKQNEDLRKEMEKLEIETRKEKDNLLEELRKLEVERDSLQEQLNIANVTIHELRLELRKHEREKSELMRAKQDVENTVAELQTRVEELEIEKRNLEMASKQQDAEIEQLMNWNSALEQRIVQRDALIQQLERDLDSNKSNSSQLRTDYYDLENSNALLTKQVAQHEKDLLKLNEELDVLRKYKQDIVSHVEALEAHNRTTNAHNAMLKETELQLREQIKVFDAHAEELEKRIILAESDRDSTNAKYEQQKLDMAALMEEVVEAKRESRQLKSSVQLLESKERVLHVSIEKLTTTMQHKDNECNELVQKLDNLRLEMIRSPKRGERSPQKPQ